MGWGTGNLGGGSGGLNFKVVGYATEAELLADTPKENTIGIITTNKITCWMFDVADPAEPVEGMVYITTGKESDIAFNALKKNGIMVYPLSAKQYVSGAWVYVTAMSYQGGEWVSWWKGELYKNGNEFEKVTGGWTSITLGGGTATKNDYSLYLYVPGSANEGWAGAWYTINAVDITEYKTLHMLYTMPKIDPSGSFLCLFDKVNANNVWNPKYESKAYVALTAGTKIEVSLDISSLTGGYFITPQTFSSGPIMYIHKVWVE